MKTIILLLALSTSAMSSEYDAVDACIEEVELQHSEIDIRELEEMKIECFIEEEG